MTNLTTPRRHGLARAAALTTTTLAAIALPAPAAQATFPGANGPIAAQGSGQVIRAIDPATGLATQIATGAAEPEYSDDGRVAWTSFYNNTAKLYVANADGTGAGEVLSGGTRISGLSWFADGTRLAFGQGDAIKVLHLASGTVSVVASQTTGRAAVRPDGTKLAFVRSGKVHVANADGSGAVALTGSLAAVQDLDWAPDGGHLLAVIAGDVVRIDAISGALTTVHDLPSGEGAVSAAHAPDGTKITYVVPKYLGWSNPWTRVYVSAVSGANPSVLHELGSFAYYPSGGVSWRTTG